MNHDDNSIPLLTEVIPMAPPQAVPAHAGNTGPDYGAAAQSGAFWQPSAPAGYQVQPLPEVASPSAEQYRQLEQEISENVLQNLLAQADSVLQQHLQDQMAVVLDNISDILTQRVKESLHQALAETVTRAVAEEMARFSSSKN
ncbi:hypothetical protein [Herbaspirillum chlorophenolicum]|uniref:hypothetical protein n=1 Tax=Herbaspirillum chlorophenolicum TaxID=211589 RepID=UPI00067D55BC|nr:hypothetical protein [Herbaspirillum chlorophenolicum]